MPAVEFLLARRLSLAGGKRRPGAGAVIAVVGVALSLAIMLLAVAVLQGFKQEIRSKVTGFEAPLSIGALSADGHDGAGDASALLEARPIGNDPALERAFASLRQVSPSARPTPVVMRPMLLKTDSAFAGVVVKGYPEGSVPDIILNNLSEGTSPYEAADSVANPIALSGSLARRLGIAVGDRPMAYFFGGENVKARRVTVTGIYDTHFGEYDLTYVFSPSALPASVDRLADGLGTRIEVYGIPDADIDESARVLQQALLNEHYRGATEAIYQVDNVHRRGAQYFNWLAMLDTNVAVVIALMAAVGSFTLISSLFILILERVSTIGLLKALGATNGFVRRVFILLAQRLVITGVIIGNIVGLGLIWLQSATRILPLDPATYYLTYVPADISVGAVLAINAGVIAVAVIVLLLPSHIIAGLNPSRTMRYE